MFTVPTIYFINIDLKIELPINVRSYIYSCKVRGEGTLVIFINGEIIPGSDNSKKYSIDNDYM